MPNSVTNIGFTDYGAEQAAIERRRKMAEMLQAQGAQPLETPQTPPGGFTPHVSWTQGLAKMLQSYTGALGQRRADEQQRQLATQYQGDVSGDIQALVKALGGRQAQTIQPDPQEAAQSADYGTPQVGPVNLPAQTPAESLTAALPGMRTPMGQQLATSYLTQQIASPEKFGHTPVKMKGPDGKLIDVLVGDRGTVRPVTNFGSAERLHFADTGAGIQPVGEYSGSPQGGSIAKTMTPSESANFAFRQFEFGNLSANQQAQIKTELARLGLQEQQLHEGRVQLMQSPDGTVYVVNKLSGVGAPATNAQGQPLNIPKPLTEAQGKANLFGTRAEEADKILKGLEERINVTGLAAKRGLENTPIIGGPMGALANTALTADQQKVEQAQRDFVNAVLRLESGAAISESEFKNAIRQYFPQPGDAKEVIEQKRKNRATAIAGLKAMSGTQSPVISNPQANQPFGQPVNVIHWNDLGRSAS